MRRRYLVAGRVQGVGFRYFVFRRAQALGLIGWVRNLPDGRVEVLADGDDAAILDLAGALAVGPRSARVEKVSEMPTSDDGITGNVFSIID